MIDLTKEAALTLNAARKLPELQRDGRRPDLATLYRWSTRGCRGRKLEVIQVGGSRCTTAAAVQRFIQALTIQEIGPIPQPVDHVVDVAGAERELAAAGF